MQIQPHRAHQPRQRVQAEETERADEQAGHRQEHQVQQRIICLVERVGVRPVFREFLRRARMTFLAGRQDVVGRKVRGRIRRRQDVMKTVAVITRGDGGRGIGPAQRQSLAVVGVPVALQPVLVAFATALVADGLEIIARRIDNFVRAVAVGADRPARVALGQQLAVDAFVISLLDAQMTLAAGLRDVRMVDGRIAVHRALDIVDAMAVIT